MSPPQEKKPTAATVDSSPRKRSPKQSAGDVTSAGKAKAPKEDDGTKPAEPDESGETLDDIAAQKAAEPEPADQFQDLNPNDRSLLQKKLLVRRFLASARGYWLSGGDRLAWVLTGGLLLLVIANLVAQYGINVWNRYIFDALEKRDSATVLWLSAVFFPLAIASVVCGVINVYVRMSLQRRWRAWLTDKLLSRWLANGHYYQLNLVSGDHKNPEYRIAEDLRVATDAPVDFVTGVVSAALSALTFITVLWTLGGSLTFFKTHLG